MQVINLHLCLNFTLPQVFFTHFASKNQLPCFIHNWSIGWKWVKYLKIMVFIQWSNLSFTWNEFELLNSLGDLLSYFPILCTYILWNFCFFWFFHCTVNVTKFVQKCDQTIWNCGSVKFTEEILNGKLHFLCSVCG